MSQPTTTAGTATRSTLSAYNRLVLTFQNVNPKLSFDTQAQDVVSVQSPPPCYHSSTTSIQSDIHTLYCIAIFQKLLLYLHKRTSIVSKMASVSLRAHSTDCSTSSYTVLLIKNTAARYQPLTSHSSNAVSICRSSNTSKSVYIDSKLNYCCYGRPQQQNCYSLSHQ